MILNDTTRKYHHRYAIIINEVKRPLQLQCDLLLVITDRQVCYPWPSLIQNYLKQGITTETSSTQIQSIDKITKKRRI